MPLLRVVAAPAVVEVVPATPGAGASTGASTGAAAAGAAAGEVPAPLLGPKEKAPAAGAADGEPNEKTPAAGAAGAPEGAVADEVEAAAAAACARPTSAFEAESFWSPQVGGAAVS